MYVVASLAQQLLTVASAIYSVCHTYSREHVKMASIVSWPTLLPLLLLGLASGLTASATPGMFTDYRPSLDGRGIETDGPSGRYFNRPL